MIEKYRNKLEQRKGMKSNLLKDIQLRKINIKRFKEEKNQTELAQKILQIVSKQTQQEVIIHISGIINLALNTIFEESYEFKIDFIEKRGKIEADIYLLKNKEDRIDPMTASGGGVVDVISFALRIALWSLSGMRNVIILDEPFRFLSRELQPRAGILLKNISKKLGLQFIIITHDKAIIDSADQIFLLRLNDKKISEIVKEE